MKKILYGFGAFTGLLIVAALIIPLFVNINDYKPQILAEVRKNLGREAQIDGDIKLSLFPSPSVNIQGIKLHNIDGGSTQHMAELEKLKISVALRPLLARKVKVTRILLSHPVIHLETLADGRNNWEFDRQERGARPEDEALPSASRDASSLEFSFDNIEIIGADIHHKSPQGLHSIHDLTAFVTAESLKGPFKIDGFLKYNEQDLRFILKVKELADSIPLKLKVDANGIDLVLEGILTQDSKTFAGTVEIKSDAKSLENLIQKNGLATSIPGFIEGPLTLASHVNISEKMLDLRNLTFELDKNTLEGQAAITFSPLSIKAGAHNIPGGTTFNLTLSPQKDQQIGQMQVAIDAPRKLLDWLGINTAGFPEELIGLTRLESDFLLKGDNLSLKNMKFRVKDTSIHGQVSGNTASRKFDYTVTAEGIMPLANFAGAPFIKDPGALHLKGSTVMNKDGSYNTRTTLTLAGLTLEATGSINLGQAMKVKLNLNANSPRAAHFFNTFIDGPAPLDRFNVDTSLVMNKESIDVAGLNAQMGIGRSQVTLKGNIQTRLGEERPYITADLKFSPVKLDALFPVALGNHPGIIEPQLLYVAMRPRAHDRSKKTGNASEAVSQRKDHWPATPINLNGLKGVDGEFKFTIPQLSNKDLTFKDVRGQGSLKNGVFEMPHIQAEFFDGKMDAQIFLKAEATPSWAFDMTIKDANIQRFLQTTNDVKIVGGQLTASTHLKSSGKSIKDWIGNLEGPVSFNVVNGALSGFDLKAVSTRIKSLTNPTALLQLFETFMTKGKTSFTKCQGTIVFKNGVGNIQEMVLNADGGQGTGAGKIDLLPYLVDITGQFALTDLPNLPPFKMRLTGPLDNPTKSLDTGNVQQYLIENIFSKLSGKDLIEGAGGIIGGILGGGKGNKKQSGSSTGQQQKPSEKDSPGKSSSPDVIKESGKAIENVLKGLF